MSDCIGSSQDHVQQSENDQSDQSPVSVHNSESNGHSHSLDEDEAIDLCMDDDDIDIIENMSPGDIVQVYAEVNRIKKIPRYQPKSGNNARHCNKFSWVDEIFDIEQKVVIG